MKKITVLDFVKYCGGFTESAKLLGCSRQYIWYQARKVKKPSFELCMKIQFVTNKYFTVDKLRPDLFDKYF